MPARARKTPKLDLPFVLTDAVRAGRVVIFLGAGASKECLNNSGDRPPDGNQLRDGIASKFFGKKMTNRSLMSVAEMAIGSAGGTSVVFDYVNSVFEGFHTSEAHKSLSDFSWRMIATTNYDIFVESAYGDVKRRRQTLIPFVKDDEPVEQRIMEVINPVQYLKLHGCLNHRLDKDIPLVLAWEQYTTHAQNRTRLFDRLKNLARESPIVFIGYSLADSHIRDLVNRIEPRSRPRWYMVDPDAEPEDIKYWGTRNVEVFVARFGQFMTELQNKIPPLMRFLPPVNNSADFPLREFYVSKTEESDQLKASFQKDLTLVHATMPYPEQTAERFYSGYDTGWGCIINRLDAKRKTTEDLLYKIILENSSPKEPMFFMVRGPAGAGKTIVLKRAAFDAATAYKTPVVWLQESGQLRTDVFLEMWDHIQKPIFLFIDQVSLHTEKLISFIKVMKARKIPLMIIGAEREADWTTYCSELENIIVPQFFKMKGLSSAEAENLIDLLKKHNCLGELRIKSREEQIAAFMKPEHADRQLLVALHILTRGMPFEKIVLDEYNRVSPEQARKMYLDISSMNQFAVPVRAGTISRISGIDFDDYEKRFFAPLMDMISTGIDNYSGDRTYRTRHPRVAELVFRQVCDTDRSKVAQFIRLIEGLDVGYTSDSRVLENICKGRTLAENFSSPEGVREIYEAAISVAPKQNYLYQQWAIFESNHIYGDIVRAEALAETASEAEPRSMTFIHTRAEVARKRANREDAVVMKEQLRRQSRELLEKMPINDKFARSTYCKLLVDETIELSEEMGDEENLSRDRFFAEKLKDTEASLARAQQDFPDDAEMSEIEARLWSGMKDKTKAMKALERAWKKMPRGMGTAIRLGKLFAAAGNSEKEYKILLEALDRSPDDKEVHYAVALHLLSKEELDMSSIERHLSSSYTLDDQNYEARYMLAQFLFFKGEVSKSDVMFQDIGKRAPKHFRKIAPKYDNAITSRLPDYSGTIDSVREGFFFIRTGSYPNKIFAHRSEFDDNEVDDIEPGMNIDMKFRFNRFGPVGVRVRRRGGPA